MMADLRESGVDTRISPRDKEKMAYGPSVTPGQPGNLIATEGMSISAWLHEYTHFAEDRRLGYPGLGAYIADAELFAEMERVAYGAEIDFALSKGYNDLAKLIEELRDEALEEIRKWGGQWT